MTYKNILIISVCLFSLACTHKKKVQGITHNNQRTARDINPKEIYHVGDIVDTYNGVPVYYNGDVSNVLERNTTPDGYNLGLKFQCVEFVKRYYYAHFDHRMPDPMGNAKDFFDPTIPDGGLNPARDLFQFKNPSKHRPQPDDILVWKGSKNCPFGHIAIVSDTNCCVLEIVQQNAGPTAPSRDELQYVLYKGKWRVRAADVVGWLRKSP